jgi:hypothetical protein
MPAKRNKRISMFRLLICSLLCGALAWVVVAGPGQTQSDVLRVPELDTGFRLLYELKPAEARTQFAARQKTAPEDPLGSAAEAASYLFEECYRQGILTSEFFLDDDRFLGEIPLKADAALRKAFFASSKRAQDLARLRLKANPDDPNALFAMTLTVGMQADYACLIDKKQLDSLRMIREADKFAKKLLAVAPEGADAYLTLGTANYIIGSLHAGTRFFLRFAGIRGDKRLGLKQIEIAAASGRYLRPFAKILLALAALREKKPDVARTQLMELVAEFPQNPLFASELAKLQSGPAQRARPGERLSSVSPPRFQFTTVENLRKEQSGVSVTLRKKHTLSQTFGNETPIHCARAAAFQSHHDSETRACLTSGDSHKFVYFIDHKWFS